MSAFGGKADMTFRGNPLLRSLLGVKRTCVFAAPVGLELSAIGLRDAYEVEQAIAAFARDPNGGLVVTASAFASNHPQSIVTLASRHKLPAVYPFRYFVDAGGLICYGPDFIDQYRRALFTSIAFLRARSRPTCQCRPRQNTS